MPTRDRGRRAGRRLHRRRRPRAAQHRDRPRRLAGRFSANLPSASCCSAPTCGCSAPTSGSPPSSAAPPTTTAARAVHDYLPRAEAERIDRDPAPGPGDRRLRSPTCTITGFVPGADERRHWSINLYRVHSGTGRPIGVAWLGTDVTAPPRRRPRGRQRPAQPRPAERGRRPHRQLPRPGDHRPRTPRRRRPRLLRPRHRRPLPGPAGRRRDPARASPTAARELRRVAFASAVSDAPFAGTGAPVSGRRRPPLPVQLALRGRPAHRPRRRSSRARTAASSQSTLAVPMVAHDTVVGLVQFSRTKGSEPFGERDRDAGRGAGRARRRLHRQRPPVPPRARARADTAAQSCCRPATRRPPASTSPAAICPATHRPTEVGGDWFDVIELPGHRTALVVGDVMGRGLRAAVAMGELRTAVRTLALLDLEPAEVLSALDEIARGLGAPGGVQQATRAARRPRESRPLRGVPRHLRLRRLRLGDPALHLRQRGPPAARAGRTAARTALMLDVPPGMPLGVGGEPFEEVEVELPEGALLALYTDGLVESRDHPLDEGLAGASGGPRRPRPRRWRTSATTSSTPSTPTTARTTSRC